jgi:hypothetical protein
MRTPKSALAALALALVVGGCNHVAALKPDPAGDAVFIKHVRQICAKTTPLASIDLSAGDAAISEAAAADLSQVQAVQTQIVAITPEISHASPLAPQIVTVEEMFVDMEKWYSGLVRSVAMKTKLHRAAPLIALQRLEEAQTELSRMGVASCFG